MSTPARAADDAFFVAGGPLRSDDPSYIERLADRELWEQLAAGEYCYLLTPRQMGKSSLMARTARELRAASTRVAVIDLTGIGGEEVRTPAEQWYYGLLYRLHRELGIATPLKPWWEEHSGMPPAQCFVEYFREVVLAAEGEVVVFVDEIDTTINLPFSDGFFAAVRACYNARATELDFGRLRFVLLGVAAPNQLISDAKRTPFNVGRRIELEPFRLEEARGLAEGFGEAADALLERIFYWTGGQPYLTQALCKAAAVGSAEPLAADPTARIDALVAERLLTARALREETHLANVRGRLLDQPGARARLLRYRRVLRGGPVADSPTSPVVSSLKLSGVVRPGEAGALRVSNRIYERIFDRKWVRENLPVDRARLVAVGTVAASLIALVFWYASVAPRSWIEQLELASEDYAVAARAHQALSANLLFPQRRADELLAQYWDRRARAAAVGERRDEALLSWLRAVKASDSDLRRRHAAHLVGSDWKRLLATMRHSDDVNVVAFSPDGTKILTGSDDGSARLWDGSSGAPLGAPMRHEGSVEAVAFSPDGTKILTGSGDGSARLWDGTSGAPLGAPMRHEGSVEAVAFSPDGTKVLTGSGDGSARLWDGTSGTPLGVPMRHDDPVLAVAFSPADSKVLTGSADGSARLWEGYSGAPLGVPMRHDSRVVAVEFSPDGTKVLTGSYDGSTRLWDGTSGEPLGAPMRHDDWIRAVAFSRDGSKILTGSYDGSAQLWDGSTGAPLGASMHHGGPVVAVAVSLEGSKVVTGSADGSARLWDGTSGAPLGVPMRHDDLVLAVAFSPDGTKVLTGSYDGSARLWADSSGAPLGAAMRHDAWVRAVAFSPDGTKVLTGSDDGSARLWDGSRGAPLGAAMRHDAWVRAVAFSPDGMKVLTGSDDGSARLWDGFSGAPLGAAMRHDAWVRAVAFSPDGTKVLTGSDDGSARLWDGSSGAPLGAAMRHDAWVRAVAFSPDGTKALTGSDDGSALLWDGFTGAALGGAMRHDNWVRAVAFSRDGTKVLTGSYDSSAHLWDGSTGAPLGASMLHNNWIQAVAFSPDGSKVLTGSADGSARLWDGSSGAALGASMRHDNWALAVAFSPDGRAWSLTQSWLHIANATREGLQPIESRHVSVAALHFPDQCSPCDEITIAVRPTGDSVRVETIRLGAPAEPPLTGDPAQLLETWQQRLALVFDDNGKLTPRWPIPAQELRGSGAGGKEER